MASTAPPLFCTFAGEREKTGLHGNGNKGGKIPNVLAWGMSLVLGLAFAFVSVLMCWHGAEIASIDSVNYLRFAQTGRCVDLPVHYGVAYPVFLWFCSLFGGEVPHITTLGNAICAFWFATILVRWLMASFRWIGVLGAMTVLANYAVLEDYARALSEGLFLVALALGVAGLSEWAESRRGGWFWMSGAAIGVACLTRYAGVAFAVCFAFCLWRAEGGGRQGWCLGGMHLGLGPGGMVAVALLHKLFFGSATNRMLGIHLAGWNQCGDAASTLISWFMPDRIWLALPMLPWLALAAILAMCAWGGFDGWKKRNLRRMLWSVSVPVYLLFLLLSYSLFDADIPFDRRMLSPLVLFLVLGWLDAFHNCRSARRWVAVAALVFWVLFGIFRARPMVSHRFREGEGWGGLEWDRSPTLRMLEATSGTTRFYSNAPGLLSWRGIGNVECVVFWQLPTSEMDNPGFMEAYDRMLDELRTGRACVVHLKSQAWMKRTIPLERIVADAELEKLAEYDDGAIFGKPGIW